MSRLIDADTVKQDIYKYIKEEGRLINPYRMLDYIDSVKTSKKAISIEWLRKYTNHRIVEFGDTWTFINCMINDWEKENE